MFSTPVFLSSCVKSEYPSANHLFLPLYARIMDQDGQDLRTTRGNVVAQLPSMI